jgi:hypothetical protein
MNIINLFMINLKDMTNINNKYKSQFLIVFLYFFLIFGFNRGEDALGAAESDYFGILEVVKLISEKPLYYFLNYIELNLRHSPVFQFYRYFSYSIFHNDFYFRAINLHLNIFIIFIFYKSLKIVFNKTNKDNLIMLSSVIFILPSFRAYSIWPDSFVFGFIFFILSIYFYIKFKDSKSIRTKRRFALYNTISLVVASYISPNFGVFILLYIYSFLKEFKLNSYFLYLLFLNLLLSIPFFYYIFILENNFLDFDVSSWVEGQNTISLNNLANKIIIIPTILIIYFFPFLFLKFNFFFTKLKKNIKTYPLIHLFIIIFPFILLPLISYEIIKSPLGGGGFFYSFLYLFENHKYLLCIISSISIILISLFFYSPDSNSKYLNNNESYLFLIALLLSSPQLTIYMMYYELILFTSIILLFQKKMITEIIDDYKRIYFLIFYYAILLTLSLTKYKFLSTLEKYKSL